MHMGSSGVLWKMRVPRARSLDGADVQERASRAANKKIKSWAISANEVKK